MMMSTCFRLAISFDSISSPILISDFNRVGLAAGKKHKQTLPRRPLRFYNSTYMPMTVSSALAFFVLSEATAEAERESTIYAFPRC